MVEGAGGPSWFTEYNVLTGLSARSYGRFAYIVDAHRGRACRARAAAGADPLRLSDVQPLSVLWRISRARAVSRPRPASSTSGHEGFWRASDCRARHASTSTRPSRYRARQAQGAAVHVRLYWRPIISHGILGFRPDLTPDWRDLGNAPHDRRVYPAAGHERARLCRAAGAPAHDFPTRVIPGRAFRRSSARIRLSHHRSHAQ